MEYTIVGKIINTHGIRGEVKVFPLTNNMDRFDFLNHAYIGEEKLRVDLEKTRYVKGFPLLKFRDYDSINDIEKFKNQYLYVDEEEKIQLPQDSFFIHELINSKVYDEKRKLIGSLTEVLQGPGNDVYIIWNEEKKKDYLIPGIKEFVISVDIDKKEIIVRPIEGMIE